MLAVGRERHVLRAQCPAGTDLRGLLAEQAGPQPELALALQRDGLGVDAAHHDEVAVERGDLVVGDVEGVVGVLDALALGGEQLHHVRFRLDRMDVF